MVSHYFTFKEAIHQPGKTVKIVAYPKWRFSCLVFFDVQVNYCCSERNFIAFVEIRHYAFCNVGQPFNAQSYQNGYVESWDSAPHWPNPCFFNFGVTAIWQSGYQFMNV